MELDGDTANNVEAFESVVRCMHDAGVGYGSINHPVDRDPVCGYVGVIGDVCPRCGRRNGEAHQPRKAGGAAQEVSQRSHVLRLPVSWPGKPGVDSASADTNRNISDNE